MEKKAKKERAKNKPKEPKTKMKLACDRLDKLLEAEGRGAAAKLAAALGVSSQAVTAYRYGTTDASLDTIIAMADYYGKSVDWFLGRTDENNWSADQTIREISAYTGLSSDAVERLHEWLHADVKTSMDSLLPGEISSMIDNGSNVLKGIQDYKTAIYGAKQYDYIVHISARTDHSDPFEDLISNKRTIAAIRLNPEVYLNSTKLFLMKSIDDYVVQVLEETNEMKGADDGKH